MTATAPPASLVPLRLWAVMTGTPLRTAQHWADEGVLDGSDKAHPVAVKHGGRWYVAPLAYRETVEIQVPVLDEAAVNARIADALRRVASQIEGGL